MREELNGILARHTKQPIKKIQLDTDRDYFMSGYEAKAYGIVDDVVTFRDKGKKMEVVPNKGNKT